MNGANPKINNINVYANSSYKGGGIYLINSVSKIENSQLYNNITTGSTYGGGGGLAALYSSISLLNSDIVNNSCGSDGFGAGVHLSYCDGIYFNNVLISDNQTDREVGGI